MPLTRDQATALAELIHVVRPSWDTRGIFTRGLVPLAKHPAPLEVIAWAALRAAADPDNRTPAVIPLNGHHWNLADRPPEPRLTPDLECPRHVGKWAGNCPLCRADQLAAPDEHEPKDDGLSHMPARERAREAARRAKRALEVTDGEPRRCEATDEHGRGRCTLDAHDRGQHAWEKVPGPPGPVQRWQTTPVAPRPVDETREDTTP